MRRITFQLLVISSAALLMTCLAEARTRPRYGDTLRAETETVVMSGDSSPDALVGLVFETLMTVDSSGAVRPGLAHDCGLVRSPSRVICQLQHGVVFHDGQPLSAASVVRALAKVSSFPCKALPGSDAISFDCDDTPQANLPAILSLTQYAISSTSADGSTVGTGPFRVERRTPTGYALKANDDYWAGRPFVDNIELTTSRSSRDQVTDLTLDRTDIVEISLEQLHRAQQERLRSATSRDCEGIFVVIDSNKPEMRDLRLRQAIALAIDRAAIHNVILQRQGEIAASLLPQWLSGYGFLFDSKQDLARARQVRAEMGQISSLSISYDADDGVERLIAERIALNVRDAGINMQAVPSGTAGTDLRIRTVALASLDPAAALTGIIDRLNLMAAPTSPNMEAMYANERAALGTYQAIPLVFLPRTTGLKDRVRNWESSPDGAWHFEDAWLLPRRGEARP